jgi:hypothetical protein
MVLLEIGLWKPFDRAPQYKPTISLSENCHRIAERCLKGYLAYHAGTMYESVVRACLTGDFEGDAAKKAPFQQRVYDVVVEPLKRLAAGISQGGGYT